MYERFLDSPVLRGAASAIDLFGALPSVTDQILGRSDAEAMAADWRAVGLDLYQAMRGFGPLGGSEGDNRSPDGSADGALLSDQDSLHGRR